MANDDVKLSLSLDEKELLKQLDDLKKRSEKALEFKVDNDALRKNRKELKRTLDDTESLKKSIDDLRNTRVKTDAWTKLNSEVEEYNKQIAATEKRIQNLMDKKYSESSGWVVRAKEALAGQKAARGPLLGQLRSLEARGVDTQPYTETEAYKEQIALLKEKQKLIRGNLVPIEREIAIQKGVTEQAQVQSGATSQETNALKALEEELARVEEKWRNVHAQQEKIRTTRLGARSADLISRGEDEEYDKLRDKSIELSNTMADLQYKIWHFDEAEKQTAKDTAELNKQAENAKTSLREAFEGVTFDKGEFRQFYNETIAVFKDMWEFSKKAPKDVTGADVLGVRESVKYAEQAQPVFNKFGEELQRLFDVVSANKEKMSESLFASMAKDVNEAFQGMQNLGKALSWITETGAIENLTSDSKRKAVRELSAQIGQLGIEMNKLKLANAVAPVDNFDKQMESMKNEVAELNALKNEYNGTPLNVDIPAGPKVEETLLGMITKLRELKAEKRKLEATSSPTMEEAQRYEEVIAEIERITNAIKNWGKDAEEASKGNDKLGDSAKKASKAGNLLKITGTGLKEAMKGYAKHCKIAEKSHRDFSRALKHGLSNLTKYVFGFRSLFFLIRRLRTGIKEGIKNLVQYDSANNETNKQMTNLMTSLLYLKNAWGAAFAPILNVVLPILSSLLDMIAAVGNAIAMFVGRLTGQTEVLQAVRVQAQDYADSLNSVGGGASRASKAADKLHDRLAAFDDLNVLGKDQDTDPSSSGGGGGGGDVLTPSINDMFTRALAENSLADMIRNAWMTDGDMSEVGALFGDFIEGALEQIPWAEIQDYAGRIGFGAGTFLTGLFGDTSTFEAMGHTIAEGLNTVTVAIHGFFEGYTAGSFASSAAGAIGAFFRDTDWSTIGQNFSDFAGTIMTEIGTFFQELDVEAISDAWEDFWTGIDWTTIASGFNEMSIGIVSLTAAVIDAGAHNVTEWLWDLFHANEGNHLGIMGMGILRLGEYCSYAVEWVVNLARSFNELRALLTVFLGHGLIGLLQGLWQFITMVIGGIIQLLANLMIWLADNVTDNIERGVNFIKFVIESNLNTIKFIITSTLNTIKFIVTSNINTIKAVWNGLKTALVTGIQFVKNQFSFYLGLIGDGFWALYDVIASVWSSIGSAITTGANGALSGLESFVNSFIDGLNVIINAINTALGSVGDELAEAINTASGGRIDLTGAFTLPTLSRVSLPRLAQGAVIPANHEFAAILGDQTHGTNIEAPLDTIKQAVAEVIANNGNAEVIRLLQQLIGVVESKNLSIGDRQIGEANARYQNRQNVIRGVRPVV